VALRPRLSPGVPLSAISGVDLRYGAVPSLSITGTIPRSTLQRPHHLDYIGERDLSLSTAALADEDGQGRRAAPVLHETSDLPAVSRRTALEDS
jgi:hypothetical protein